MITDQILIKLAAGKFTPGTNTFNRILSTVFPVTQEAKNLRLLKKTYKSYKGEGYSKGYNTFINDTKPAREHAQTVLDKNLTEHAIKGMNPKNHKLRNALLLAGGGAAGGAYLSNQNKQNNATDNRTLGY